MKTYDEMFASAKNMLEDVPKGREDALPKDITTIATMWRTYLLRKGIIDVNSPSVLTPSDVCVMVSIIKMVQLASDPDNGAYLSEAMCYLATAAQWQRDSDE